PLVRQLRPGASWDRIAHILTIRSVKRPWDGRPWTRDSLIRACKRLVQDGFLPAEVMERGPRGAENDGLVELVAAVWSALPSPSLSACARHLQAQHVLTPRGGFRWSPSSVRNLLERARERSLLEDERTRTQMDAGIYVRRLPRRTTSELVVRRASFDAQAGSISRLADSANLGDAAPIELWSATQTHQILRKIDPSGPQSPIS
ncbi:MAG: hypothetical protein AAFZ09_14425, partial [Pseudomonadota bacterium]